MEMLMLVLGVSASALVFWALYARSRFLASLDALEKAVQAQNSHSGSRDDLPPEIVALALRLGAKTDSPAGFVTLRQTGEMWSAPGAKPMAFEARQSNSLMALDYIWQARFAPFSSLIVVDYNVSDHAGLEVYLGGIIPIVRNVGNPAILRGEMMRYLAELALAPDAILKNREIDWLVIDARTFVAGKGSGVGRVEVTLHLGRDGLIESVDAAARPAQVGKLIIDRPWGGRFWDYQLRSGRTLPMQAEVYWVIDGKRFIYWRGRVTDWTINA